MPLGRHILDYRRADPAARRVVEGMALRLIGLLLVAGLICLLVAAILASLPAWLKVGGFAVVLILSAALLPGEVRRGRARRRLGYCEGCGYDLRRSAGRCSECGADLPEELVRRRRIAAEVAARRPKPGPAGVDNRPAPPLAFPAPNPSAATESSTESSPAESPA